LQFGEIMPNIAADFIGVARGGGSGCTCTCTFRARIDKYFGLNLDW